MSCRVLRIFDSTSTSTGEATLNTQRELQVAAMQLSVLHRTFNAAARNVKIPQYENHFAIVVTDTDDKFGSGPKPSCAQTEVGTFAIPVTKEDIVDGSRHMLMPSDSIKIDDCFGTPIFDSIAVSALFEMDGEPIVKVNVPSASSRFTCTASMYGVLDTPPGIEDVSISTIAREHFNVPQVNSIHGWIVIEIYDVSSASFSINNDICVPTFPMTVVRQRHSSRVATMTELTRTELQNTTKSRLEKALATAVIYFDDNPDLEPLTPVVAEHITACLENSTVKAILPSMTGAKISPFTNSRNVGGLALNYCKVVFAGFENESFYDILRGRGFGDLTLEKVFVGEDIPPTEMTKGNLYFRIGIHHPQVISNMLNLAVKTATSLGLCVEDAVTTCTEYFRKQSWKSAENAAIAEFKTIPAIRALYFWGYMVRLNSQIKYVSNHSERVQVADATAAMNDDYESIDIAPDNGNYAHSISTVVDSIVATIDRNTTMTRFTLYDARYAVDELSMQMMTAMFLTPATTNFIRVNFMMRGNAQSIEKISNDIKALIVKESTRRTVSFGPGRNPVEYPLFKTSKTSFDNNQNMWKVMFGVSFAQDTNDAARIVALFHILVLDDVMIYVTFKCMRPPPKENYPRGFIDLGSGKYILGKDTRMTPSWTDDYEDACKFALEARRAAYEAANAGSGHKVTAYSIGAITSTSRFDDLVKTFVKTGDPKDIIQTNEFEYAIAHIKSFCYPELKVKLLKILATSRTKMYLNEMKQHLPTLMDLAAKKLKDPTLNESYGLASRTYRQLIYSAIEISKHSNLTLAELKQMMIELHKDRFLKIVDDCFETHMKNASAKKTKTVFGTVAEVRPTNNSAVTAETFTDRLRKALMKNVTVEEINTDALLDKANDEALIRYQKIVQSHNTPGEMVSVADRIWALDYERRPRFVGKKTFLEEAKSRVDVTKCNRIGLDIVRNVIKVFKDYSPGSFLGNMVSEKIVEFWNRIQDVALANDLLMRLQHWMSTPSYAHADFPDTIWSMASYDPLRFHKWSVEHKITTSVQFGQIDWDRRHAPAIFLDTFVAMINEDSDSVKLVQGGDGSYHNAMDVEEFEATNVTLKSFLSDIDDRRRLDTMASEPPQLSDTKYAEIIETMIKLAIVDKRSERGISTMLEKYLLRLSVRRSASIEKKYMAEAIETISRLEGAVENAQNTVNISRKYVDDFTKILKDLKDTQKEVSASLSTISEDIKKLAFLADIEATDKLKSEIATKTEAMHEMQNKFGSLKAEINATSIALKNAETRFELADLQLSQAKKALNDSVYRDESGQITTKTKRFVEMVHLEFPTRVADIDVNGFVTTLMKRYRQYLDRVIYVGMIRTKHYICAPFNMPLSAKPVGMSSSSSDVSVTEISSSDLGIGSQTSDTLHAITKCPDETITKTENPRYTKISYRPRIDIVAKTTQYFGTFIS